MNYFRTKKWTDWNHKFFLFLKNEIPGIKQEKGFVNKMESCDGLFGVNSSGIGQLGSTKKFWFGTQRGDVYRGGVRGVARGLRVHRG